MQGGVVLPAQVPQRFDVPRKSRATGERPMVRFLPALTPKANGCGLFHSLLRSADVGVLDDLRPFGDFGLDIAIERIGRGGVDGHSVYREALSSIRLSHKPSYLRVKPQYAAAQ